MPSISYPTDSGRVTEIVIPWCEAPRDTSPVDDAPDFVWTADLVKRLMVIVIKTLRASASDGPAPVVSHMPKCIRSALDAYGYDEEEVRVRPSNAAMALLDRILPLVYQVADPRERLALSGFAEGVPLRVMAGRLHCGKSWVGVLVERGAQQVANFLNEGTGQNWEF